MWEYVEVPMELHADIDAVSEYGNIFNGINCNLLIVLMDMNLIVIYLMVYTEINVFYGINKD